MTFTSFSVVPASCRYPRRGALLPLNSAAEPSARRTRGQSRGDGPC